MQVIRLLATDTDSQSRGEATALVRAVKRVCKAGQKLIVWSASDATGFWTKNAFKSYSLCDLKHLLPHDHEEVKLKDAFKHIELMAWVLCTNAFQPHHIPHAHTQHTSLTRRHARTQIPRCLSSATGERYSSAQQHPCSRVPSTRTSAGSSRTVRWTSTQSLGRGD